MEIRERDAALLGLLAAGLVLHAGAVVLLGRFPPSGLFEAAFTMVPALVHAGALGVLLRAGDRRAVAVSCAVQWAVVGFTLPAYLLGLAFAPAAAMLTLAVRRADPDAA